MATEQILNTRIQLKYDTLANWNASTFNLKKGEIALVEVPTVEGATLQPVMFKVGVGDKKFSELDWVSAKAADVYGWAKKSQAEFETYVKGLVDTVSLSNYYTKAEVDALLKAITDAASLLAGRVSTLENKYNIDKNLSVIVSELEDKIAGIDTGVTNVTGANAIAVSGDGTKVVSLVIDPSAGNVVLSQSTSGLKAEVDLSNHALKSEIRTDEEIKNIATTEIGRLIDVSGDDETLKNIGALVDYVENNAADIAELVTNVNTANTNASNAVSTANTAAGDAATAKTTAESAVEIANEAKSGAEGSAAAAKGYADNAYSSANEAGLRCAGAEEAEQRARAILDEVSDVATGAQAIANSAVSTANEANSAAQGAVETANAAKAAADTAVQSVAAGEGLKATREGNAVTIGFDPDVVFVFNCGTATTLID